MLSKKKKRIRTYLKQTFGKKKEAYFDFDRIEAYHQKKEGTNALQQISDKTCLDLDLHAFFKLLDRTTSCIGQQYLYDRIRSIPAQSKDLSQEEALIERFSKDESFRLKVQEILYKLSGDNAYYVRSLFQERLLEPPSWFYLVGLLSFTSALALILAFFNSVTLFILLGTFVINIVIHYWNKRNLSHYLGSLTELLRLKSVATKLYQYPELKKIDLDLPKALESIQQIQNRMWFFKLEGSMEGDLSSILWSFMELFKIMFLLEPLMLFSILHKLDTRRKEIEEVFHFVGEVDSFLSIASLRVGCENYCIPTIVAENSIMTESVYHPLIEKPVSNSLDTKGKSILLTGSNMSGKTSFIRTIGLNIISGLTLNTCFAQAFQMPRMTISSAIRISDDLLNDRSYYFEEVLTIKEMLNLCKKDNPHLFLLDEIFKGTNTIERISAGKAVLSLLAQGNNLVFVSTHDIELADLLQEEYSLYHFSEKLDDQSVDFDYKLKEGKLKNRNAIRILEINGYPKSLVDEARGIAAKLDADSAQK